MRGKVITDNDLYAVIINELVTCRPEEGCWLYRNDDDGFIETATENMQLQRVVLELACVDSFVPPDLTERSVATISAFCDALPEESPVSVAAFRLKDSLTVFLPWLQRQSLLRSIRDQAEKRVPHKTLIFARTSAEAYLAQLVTGGFVTDLATPNDAVALVNSRWAVFVAVNYTPEQLGNEFAISTVAAQKWICWNTAEQKDTISSPEPTGS